MEPITSSASRKKLIKASRFLLFDLGVRRLAASEGTRLRGRGWRLKFWRDPDGPEVDWVLEREGKYVPIEVKLTDSPLLNDTRHLAIFMREYKAKRGLVVCTAPRPVRLNEAVTAIPWHDLAEAIGASAT